MFESIPTYPNPYRYWDLVQRHKVTQFYTAPTAGTYVTMYNILMMITAFIVWNVLYTHQIFCLFLLSHVLLFFSVSISVTPPSLLPSQHILRSIIASLPSLSFLSIAVRALMRYDTKPIADYDLSSLRVLGSVGTYAC